MTKISRFNNFKPVKKFYRIEYNTGDGVWYNKNKTKRENSPLNEVPMDYDENHLNHISCVGSIDDIYGYFGEENLNKLLTFETNNYKEYSGYYLIPINEYNNLYKKQVK